MAKFTKCFTVLLFLSLTDQSKGFLYIKPSKEYNGKTARLRTQFILPAYKCLSFSHHMNKQQIGKLSVYFKSYQDDEILLWRLVGGTSREWKYGEIPINSSNAYEVCKAYFEVFDCRLRIADTIRRSDRLAPRFRIN